MKFLLTLSLIPISFTAKATSLPDVQLRYEYLEKGISICSGEKRVSLGEQYLLCDRSVAGTKVLLKTMVNFDATSGMISSEVEHIDADGKMLTVSKPRVAFTDGEMSSISQENDHGDSLRLNLTATFLPAK